MLCRSSDLNPGPQRPSVELGSTAHRDAAMPGNILIVEDDRVLVDVFSQTLVQAGYTVHVAGDGREMREVIEATPIDLVLVDIGLPGEDGLTLTRFLREHTQVGVIIVTGRTDPVDRVIGIEIGADDYLSKPVFPRELLARVRAVLRRIKPRAGNRPAASEIASVALPPERGPERISFDHYIFDRPKRQLCRQDGRPVRLTTGEFNLLAVLIGDPGEPLSRQRLMELVYGRDWTPDDRGIDQLVTNLRRKLEANPNRPEIIVSVRGVGYAFTASTRPATDRA
jgi:DNA-binding response OmpR family regulator